MGNTILYPSRTMGAIQTRVHCEEKPAYALPQPKIRIAQSHLQRGAGEPGTGGSPESAEVARLQPSSSIPARVKPPAQFLAAPAALPRHHPPIPNAPIPCTLSAAAFLPPGCPVALLQSCSLLLSSLSRGVKQSSKGQLGSPALQGPGAEQEAAQENGD